MNKYQSNKMNAYVAVRGVLEKNQKTWKTVPVLVKVVEEFSSRVDEISAISTQRELDTTGETLAKNEARKDLARHASKLAACAMAYAFDRSDTELEAALDYSYSEIEHVKDADALQISAGIYKVLNRDLPGLDEYLVSGEDLRELKRLRRRFNDAMVTKHPRFHDSYFNARKIKDR